METHVSSIWYEKWSRNKYLKGKMIREVLWQLYFLVLVLAIVYVGIHVKILIHGSHVWCFFYNDENNLIMLSTTRETHIMGLKGNISRGFTELFNGYTSMTLIFSKLSLLCVACYIALGTSSGRWVNFSDECILWSFITTKFFYTWMWLMDTYLAVSSTQITFEPWVLKNI